MVNNFNAVTPMLQEIEAVVNAVPIKNSDTRQAVYMIMKHLEQLEFWVDRATKTELNR